MKILNTSFPRVGIELQNRHIYSCTLVPLRHVGKSICIVILSLNTKNFIQINFVEFVILSIYCLTLCMKMLLLIPCNLYQKGINYSLIFIYKEITKLT